MKLMTQLPESSKMVVGARNCVGGGSEGCRGVKTGDGGNKGESHPSKKIWKKISRKQECECRLSASSLHIHPKAEHLPTPLGRWYRNCRATLVFPLLTKLHFIHYVGIKYEDIFISVLYQAHEGNPCEVKCSETSPNVWVCGKFAVKPAFVDKRKVLRECADPQVTRKLTLAPEMGCLESTHRSSLARETDT